MASAATEAPAPAPASSSDPQSTTKTVPAPSAPSPSGSEPNPAAKPVHKHRKEDFELGHLLGGGAFAKVVEGTVIYEQSPQFGTKYAVKIMDKKHMVKHDKVKYVCVCATGQGPSL